MMSITTKTFLAIAWTAAGAGIAILGDLIHDPSLIVPGFLLAVLGVGVAIHIEHSRHFTVNEGGQQADRPGH